MKSKKNSTTYHKTKVSGVEIFHREVGNPKAPVLLLLHGFPTSSHMFRNLIPELAADFRVIAPDLPGFGLSGVPRRKSFRYTFDSMAQVIGDFVEQIGLKKFAIYIFDYGAPVGLRLALRFPDRISALVTQNGNAYVEGFSAAWEPWQTYWRNPTAKNREACRDALSPAVIRDIQYLHGTDAQSVSPDGYTLDIVYMSRPGADEMQLDLILDYRTNVALYPKFQEFFRTWQPPTLAVWGKNDPFFLPAGARAYRRDNPKAKIIFYDTGHFALETHAAEIGHEIRSFLKGLKIKKANHLMPNKSMKKANSPKSPAPTSLPEEYDLLVLGSGEGGKFLAWTLAKKGMKAAVIERKYIGGSCPNIACLPSKNLIHSAKVASYFFRSAEFGIYKDNVTINMPAVRERKRSMVNSLVAMHVDLYKKSGAELIMGSGRFVGPKTIEVTSAEGQKRTLTGKNVVINTGTHTTIEPIPGLTDAKPLTHIEALELDTVPAHLIVMGGGYIGLELSQAMRRFGSRVTIVERNPRLVHREDEDVASALHEMFQDEGINVLTNAAITRVEGQSGQSVKLHLKQGNSETTLESTHLLVATGRTPNTSSLGLDVAGVKLTDRGYVQVNERLETTTPGVWAIGDCAGSPQFTHISFDDFRIVRDNILGGNHVTAGRQVPFCMFTDPEFARIGLGETEAKQKGIAYRLAKIPMAAVLRTRTLSETGGFMKALIDDKTDRILGFTALGTGAGEIMGTVQVAMLAGLPYTALRDAVFTHPTLTEGLVPLFTAVPTKA